MAEKLTKEQEEKLEGILKKGKKRCCKELSDDELDKVNGGAGEFNISKYTCSESSCSCNYFGFCCCKYVFTGECCYFGGTCNSCGGGDPYVEPDPDFEAMIKDTLKY